MARALLRLLAASVLLLPAGVGAAPAYAAGRVVVDNEGRGAVIDARYSSELTLSGRGFQSIKGGHGGIYVWFGTVNAGWQPSKGGQSGADYVYVPDSESKSNAGFQRFVAFPGSDTAGSASSTMGADGSWSVRLVVPGPTFQGVGRDGTVKTVDCRKVTCGVITVGAHGVHNAHNETFTPVAVRELTGSATLAASPSVDPDTGSGSDRGAGSGTGSGTSTTGNQGTGNQATGRASTGPTKLRVDRRSAVAGRAMAFSASGLQPGEQVSVVLDNGLVASGPHLVGLDGRVTGVLALPSEVDPGTHELRLFGASRAASVRFPITAADASATGSTGSGDDADTESQAAEPPAETSTGGIAALAFALLGALAFGASLFVFARRRAGGRRVDA